MQIPSFEKVGRWLPFLADPITIENFCANNALYPTQIPLDRRDLYFSLALLREKIRSELRKDEGRKTLENGEETIVLTPQLIRATPNLGLATCLAIDAFEPTKICKILAETKSQEKRLGVVLSLTHVNQGRKEVAQVVLKFDKKADEKIKIPPGEITVIPISEKQKVALFIHCGGAKILGRKSLKIKLQGGEVGIIIDSRGRPIDLAFGLAESRQKVARWMEVFE